MHVYVKVNDLNLHVLMQNWLFNLGYFRTHETASGVNLDPKIDSEW